MPRNRGQEPTPAGPPASVIPETTPSNPPATPPPPPPPETPESIRAREEAELPAQPGDRQTDRNPFWRNMVDTALRRRNLPRKPDQPLEMEKNYSRAEEINQLVDAIRDGTWRRVQEARIFKERYGYGRNVPQSLLRTKAWLAGEYDMQYNPATGEVDFNYLTETLRRTANVAINVAEFGGLTAAFGILTSWGLGGVALVKGGALLGNAIGRAAGEIYQAAAGKERIQREQLTIGYESYFKMAYELASRVGREQPDFYDRNGEMIPWADTTPEEQANYAATRNAAVRDLVNYVHSSEQNSVVFAQRPSGAYFNDFRTGRVTGEPLEAGGFENGEPEQSDIGPGPTLNNGTRVYQPSGLAPDATRLAEMEKEFSKYRAKADKMKTIFSGVGGLVGGVAQVLATQKAEFVKILANLNSGESTRLNIDGNTVWHAVQTKGGSIAIDANNNATNLVYNLNNQLEAMRAAFGAGSEAIRSQLVGGGRLLQNIPELISHHLQVTMSQLIETINRQAWYEAARTAGAIIGGITVHSIWKGANIGNERKRFDKERNDFEQNEEVIRRRMVPEERFVPIKELARQYNKAVPEVGQTWRRQFGDGEFEYLEILEIDKREDRVVLTVAIKRPGETDLLVDRMSAERLLENPNPDDPDNPNQGWRKVITNRPLTPDSSTTEPAGTPPASSPAPGGGGLAPTGGGGAPGGELTPNAANPEQNPPVDEQVEGESDDIFEDGEKAMRDAQKQPKTEDEQPEPGAEFKEGKTYTALIKNHRYNKTFEAEIDGKKVDYLIIDNYDPEIDGEVEKLINTEVNISATKDSIRPDKKKNLNQLKAKIIRKEENVAEAQPSPKVEKKLSDVGKAALEAARNPFDTKNVWVLLEGKNGITAENLKYPGQGLKFVKLDPNREYKITITDAELVDSPEQSNRTLVRIESGDVSLITPIEYVNKGFELKAMQGVKGKTLSRVKKELEISLRREALKKKAENPLVVEESPVIEAPAGEDTPEVAAPEVLTLTIDGVDTPLRAGSVIVSKDNPEQKTTIKRIEPQSNGIWLIETDSNDPQYGTKEQWQSSLEGFSILNE